MRIMMGTNLIVKVHNTFLSPLVTLLSLVLLGFLAPLLYGKSKYNYSQV